MAAARSWCAHLRAGGTTPWAEWQTASGSADGPGELPGAAQLELLRLLNEDGGLAWPTDRVLRRAAPDRGPAHLSLPWPPTDRVAPLEEVLRVGAGVLADLVVARPPAPAGPVSVSRRVGRAPRFVLTGMPCSVAAVRADLAAAGLVEHRPARGPWRREAQIGVVVLGSPREALLQAWSARVQRGGARPWSRYVAAWAARDRLPAAADLGGTVRDLVARLGAANVHVLVAGDDPSGDVGRLLGRDVAATVEGYGRPALLDPAVVDVLRRVNGVLPFLLERPGRVGRRRGLVEVGRTQRGGPSSVAVPEPWRAWVAAGGVRLADEVAASGARVHGDLGRLRDADPVRAPLRRRDTLDAMLRMIHRVDEQVDEQVAGLVAGDEPR